MRMIIFVFMAAAPAFAQEAEIRIETEERAVSCTAEPLRQPGESKEEFDEALLLWQRQCDNDPSPPPEDSSDDSADQLKR